jgi:hypothetical protein
MANKEVHVVLIPVHAMSNGRRVFERNENHTFQNRTQVENAICFDEDDPLMVEDLTIIPLTDFMDWMNNHDDDLDESQRFNPQEFWFGYVNIEKK